MGVHVSKSAEPIPGYTIVERIGAGGYGEVWKADAPGGLTKAIKFVYGYFNDERAAGELKALNRIREVRHPFLLSLERIEVIDGQLVIVTELADESLKERFEAIREQGQAGIDRPRLLDYLADAADALDYMREEHSLQHLDVKPENLLLLGGRIKVADFGLVKDVYATGASLMGGMTPVYSSPEVFDGRPSRFSDQYSLAIVYQEMLTGVLPFSGRTAAQLAKQHTSTPPRLSPLPLADQPIIARALSKEPDKRFPSCRALIDQLRRGGEAAGPQVASAGACSVAADEVTADTKTVAGSETEIVQPAAPVPSTVKTMAIDGSAPRRSTRIRRSGPAAPRPAERSEVVELPPLDLPSTPAQLTPTLYVGIGGTAIRTLKQLRRRLSDRYGKPEAAPVLQMLLIDTDSNDLVSATRGEPEDSFHDTETVAAPLRRPQEYRRDAPQLLSWLSRRWLYNIPRSLRTHGLRPLGRLALVDHAAQFNARMRQALGRAIDPASARTAADNTGLAVRDDVLRVVIVASISGGTGSGMVLDMAYAVRQVLRDMERHHAVVQGILVHSSSRSEEARDLAITNAYACLGELYTYSHPEGFYPGEKACGLDPCETGQPTFDQTYLMHLGDELSDRDYQAATERVADYLYVDAVTPAGPFFDACRLPTDDAASTDGDTGDVLVRTFGTCQVGCSRNDLLGAMGHLLCRSVLSRWRGDLRGDSATERETTVGVVRSESPPEGSAAERELERLVRQQIESVGLDLQSLVDHFDAAIGQQVGDQIDAVLVDAVSAGWRHRQPSGQGDGSVAAAARALRTLQAAIGYVPVGADDETAMETPEIDVPLDTLIGETAQIRIAELERTICGWIVSLVDAGPLRLTGAQQAAGSLAARAEAVEAEARAELEGVEQQLRHLAAQIVRQPGSSNGGAGIESPLDSDGRPRCQQAIWLMEYGTLAVHAVRLRNVCRVTQAVQATLASVQKRLRDVRGELDRLVEAFDILVHQSESSCEEASTDDPLKRAARAAGDAIRLRVPELAAEVDRSFREDFLAPHGGLCSVLTSNVDLRASLPGTLRNYTRTALRSALHETKVADRLLLPAHDSDGGATAGPLAACLDAAAPPWSDCGGARRLLVILPEGAEAAPLAQQITAQHPATPSIVHDSDPEVRFCFEVERLPLSSVARTLLRGDARYADIANRLHTRIDVQWTTFAVE